MMTARERLHLLRRAALSPDSPALVRTICLSATAAAAALLADLVSNAGSAATQWTNMLAFFAAFVVGALAIGEKERDRQ